MRNTLVGFVLVCSAQALSATNWVRVTKSYKHDNYYMDIDTLGTHGKYRTAWFKNIPAQPKDGEAYSMDYIYFDCADHTSVIETETYYSSVGESLRSSTARASELRFVPNAPGTVAESQAHLVCK